MNNIDRLLVEVDQLADQQRYQEMVECLTRARSLINDPELVSVLTYNIGTIYWGKLGDGVQARRGFLEAINSFEDCDYALSPDRDRLKTCHANALENAMLCSLSFEEYEALADRLLQLQPDAVIVRGQSPRVRDKQRCGLPWWLIMFSIAQGYYDRGNPRRDAGRYGEARSTFHLLWVNRRDLRLPREHQRFALVEIAALTSRMAADLLTSGNSFSSPEPPPGYRSLLQDTIRLMREFLHTNTGDRPLRKMCENLVAMSNQARAQRNGNIEPPSLSRFPPPPHMQSEFSTGVIVFWGIVTVGWIAWLVKLAFF